MTTLMLALVLVSSAMAKDPCADQGAVDAAAAELLENYTTDRVDHEGAERPTDLAKRDKDRLKTVAKLVDKGLAGCTADAAMHAAWVMQRSKEAGQLEAAYKLAQKAMEASVQNGAYLAAVTYDLHQVSRGAKQRYATQMASMNGKHCIYPVATDSTDAERAQYGLPTLEEAFRRLLNANGMEQDQPTAEIIELRGLWCDLKPW